jgi:hypothetical protein
MRRHSVLVTAHSGGLPYPGRTFRHLIMDTVPHIAIRSTIDV